MRINLKFDANEAEWLVEFPENGLTLPTQPNAPLSVILGTIRAARPHMGIDIDRESLFAYHAYKAVWA